LGRIFARVTKKKDTSNQKIALEIDASQVNIQLLQI